MMKKKDFEKLSKLFGKYLTDDEKHNDLFCDICFIHKGKELIHRRTWIGVGESMVLISLDLEYLTSYKYIKWVNITTNGYQRYF